MLVGGLWLLRPLSPVSPSTGCRVIEGQHVPAAVTHVLCSGANGRGQVRRTLKYLQVGPD